VRYTAAAAVDEDTLADLKQFIVAVITQQTVGLRADMRTDFARLDNKIDDLSAFVAEAINFRCR
jgi:hypothetical protein